ncbi:questin oxidase family protein [Streptomyces coeruleoprunus]|uniref:Questin oxidase family protein n=1 Tax=Streptomyces coeruleoprunus TaxID=285563 RepID=A0ABV9XRM5_9ACTN
MPSLSYLDALNDALERMDDLGYERGKGVDVANHGPMGAEALALMGRADDVAGWVRRYRRALEHHEPPGARFALDPADEASWRPALGRFDRAGDWERLFARELSDAPWRDVLARWWPRLLPGLFAGLTHGLIRTAHAVRGLYAAASPTRLQLTELARGLAYWAARYTELPGEPRLAGPHGVASAIAALPRVPEKQPPPQRLARLSRIPGYAESLDGPAPEQAERLLSEMTAEFAGVYLAHPELPPVPLIHGVTAPAAARLVLPHLPRELHAPTLARLWQIQAAMLLAFTTGPGAEAAPPPDDAPELAELTARAVEHGDEHVVKFTEACLREYALRPDPRFPAAAHAALLRVPRLDDGGGVSTVVRP